MTRCQIPWKILSILILLPGVAPSQGTRDESRVEQDCIRFNPQTAEVAMVQGRWKIVDGDHWMFDFEANEGEARQAFSIIQYYRMNLSCFAGRPHPPMAYLLVSSEAPVGPAPGEQCVRFDSTRLELSQSPGSSRIVSGTNVLFDFGDKDAEAKRALRVLRHYEFDYKCSTDPSNAHFLYLRR